jgi:hypothetical protein
MIKDETGPAPTTYGDSKTGGNFTSALPLRQREGYTLDSNGRATFTKGNKLQPLHKSVRLHAREFILQCIKHEGGVKNLVVKIYAQAMKGNFRAQEMLMNYIFGRPTESVKIESVNTHEISTAPVVKIIADHLRLEKLERDAANVPTVVEEQRVEEMERILNNAVSIAQSEAPPEVTPPTKRKYNVKPIRKHTTKKRSTKRAKKK